MPQTDEPKKVTERGLPEGGGLRAAVRRRPSEKLFGEHLQKRDQKGELYPKELRQRCVDCRLEGSRSYLSGAENFPEDTGVETVLIRQADSPRTAARQVPTMRR